MAGNSLKVDIAMDASGLVNGAKQATGAIKEISQEVSQADNSFKSIRSEINKQQSEVNKLANAYMQMRDKYGETSAAAIDYKTKLDSSVQSLAKLKAENEGVQNAIKQATQAIMQEGNAVQQSAQQIQSVSQRFEEIKNSGEPMKQQLRELKGLLAEMNFNGQGMSEEFNEVAQYAGKLKDAISDANTATNVFANDTANLQAVIQSVQLITAGFSALRGTMSMLGIENKNFEATMKKIQGAMLTLNALQQMANLLNKNSILIQRLQVTWYKVKDAVLKAQTISLKANTTAEAINTAGTKLSTITQNAWNVAKAVAKALLGDFTGLLIVGIGALATYAMATSDSTEEIEKQTDALANNTNGIDDNTKSVDKNKEAQEEWAKDVASSCAEQISTYRMLQQKWNECNGDVKLQGKFMRDYKSEIDSLGLGIHGLLDAEKAFVSYTDSVVAAIYARARAEAYKNQITKSAEREIELMMQNEKDLTYTWKPASKDDRWTDENGNWNEIKGAGLKAGVDYDYYSKYGFYYYKGQGADKINAYRKQQGYEQWRQRHNDRVAQIYGERENQAALRKLQQREVDIVTRELAKAGLSAKDYSSATGGGAKSVYGNYGRGGSGGRGHSSRGGSGGSGKGGERGPSDQEVLRALEEKILDMKQNLTLDLIPEGEVDNYVQELTKFTQKYDELAEKLGAPLYGSLDWKKKELADLQRNMTSGYIDEKDLDNARDKVELLKKEIEDEEIELGIKEPKALEEELDEQIKKWQDYLARNIDILPDEEIVKTKKKIRDLTNQKFELRVRLGLEEPLLTDFEKNQFAGKYENDWNDLQRYVDEYSASAQKYQEELNKYNHDLDAYNSAWDEYNNKQKKYEEELKKYNKYLEYRNRLQKQYTPTKDADGEDQYPDEYYDKLNEYIKKHYQLTQSTQTEADANDQLKQALAEVEELYNSKLITLEQYQQRVNEIQANTSVKLTDVPVTGIRKPTLPVQPVIEKPQEPFNPLKSELIDNIFKSLDGIPQHTQQIISQVEDMLNNDELSMLVRVELENSVLPQLRKKLEEETRGQLTIPATVEPTIIEKGSEWDKLNSFNNASSEGSRIQQLYELKIINYDEAKTRIDALNALLKGLKMDPLDVPLKPKWMQTLDNAAGVVNNLGDSFKSLGDITDEPILNIAGTIAQAIANLWLSYSQATVAAGGTLGPWGWAAFSLAGLAQMIGIISQIKANKYAGGGIVTGNSTVGDKLYARLNGGEIVMNDRQQQHLMNILNGAPLQNNGYGPINTTIKVKGSDLYLALSNYGKTKSLTGKNIGIK